MARVNGPNGYSGNIGNLNYYVVNGITYVRLRRRKQTRREKESKKFARCRENLVPLQVATRFSREMRTGVPEVYAKDSRFHGRIRSLLCKKVIHRDYINARGKKKVLREFIPAIRDFVSNVDFPKSISNKLKSARISEVNGEVFIDIPRISLKRLYGDEFMLWITVNRMDLIRSESIASDRRTIRMPGSTFAGGRFTLQVGPIEEDECLVVSIGINSFREGKLQKGKGRNGFVMLGY
jgi:hypothetical protein